MPLLPSPDPPTCSHGSDTPARHGSTPPSEHTILPHALTPPTRLLCLPLESGALPEVLRRPREGAARQPALRLRLHLRLHPLRVHHGLLAEHSEQSLEVPQLAGGHQWMPVAASDGVSRSKEP